MSTILKALRRVEAEHPGQAPRRSMRGDIVGGGDKPPPVPRGPKKPRRPNLLLWGSLGAALLLAALVWWRLPSLSPGEDVVEAQAPTGAPNPEAPPARPVARRPPAPLAAAPAPNVAPQAPVPAAPATGPAVGHSDLPAEVAERLPPLGETLDATGPAPAVPVAEATPAPPVEQPPPPEPPATLAAHSESLPPPAAAPIPKAPAAPPAAVKPPPASVPAPKRKPPPVVAKKSTAPPAPSAPRVQVERTSWHPKPERRVAWVLLEGASTVRELHEGDVLGTLVVKEIRPSAVVFLDGSKELQRRVGER